ncbi:hypothetical protein DRF60_13040 [Chryseobacterium elymi]|uniref:Terpene synthase n=1 Tax=Chryseobacterium elymi TaxID=395936 RepID=A0A3D9DFL7_9FLAO|nr:terpene synthase family protein [Chryseobacterium elymi]REC76810.1 hypothetical protein DRF60_13040 [Chryseobacterium elymi]
MTPQEFDSKNFIPLNYYPWPAVTSKFIDRLGKEEWNYIDKDFTFVSEKTREKYKHIKLFDVLARMQGYLSWEQILPCTRFLFWQTFIDDQYDHDNIPKLERLRKRVVEVLQGDKVRSGEFGLLNQVALTRDEFKACTTPEWMERFIHDTSEYILYGVEEESLYRARNEEIPSIEKYALIRQYSIGMYPHYDFVELGVDFPLAAQVINHPVIQRIRMLAVQITIWQNDIHSLKKEMYNKNDNFNAVFVLQKIHQLSFEEAIQETMRIHDAQVAEMITLHKQLPDFGLGIEHQKNLSEWVTRLGAVIQGINTYYNIHPYRYTPDGHAWPEHRELNVRE